jgi:nucleotide-binding universal stress UspA family protein
MDHNRLKGRLPAPFETIAVAVAFSPSLEALLSEAWQLAQSFKAELLLIHVGKKTSDKEAALVAMCANVGIGGEAKLLWRGGDTVAALLETCKENIVDLLVLGALPQETVFRYYRGSVARGLSRRAKCSLLLLTEPRREGSTFKRIMVDCVDHPKTLHTLDTAFYFGSQTGAEEIYVVGEVDPAGLVMALSGDTTQERDLVKEQPAIEAEENTEKKIASCNTRGMLVQSSVLFGRPGFMIRKFAEDRQASLLVINSPDSRYGLMDRIFTHDMEYILEHLPCHILIVHSRPAGGP